MEEKKFSWTDKSTVAISIVALLSSIWLHFDLNWAPPSISGTWKANSGCKVLRLEQANREIVGDCLNDDKSVLHLLDGKFVDESTVKVEIIRVLVAKDIVKEDCKKPITRKGVIKLIDSGEKIALTNQNWIGACDLNPKTDYNLIGFIEYQRSR
ncbi:hypothetical protein ACV4QK_20535 (plasmid) [Alteromonas macleodii]